MKVDLAASQVRNIVDFIELEFIDSIRRDVDIDNMDYIVDMVEALKALKNAVSKELKGTSNKVHTRILVNKERDNGY